jgi:hypothetical protein
VADEVLRVGIISCSGEEVPEGTISRLATRRVLELLRPGRTVTICLPLFLAGNEAEQEFARTHPTITVDGCDKLCAKKGTEQYSGPVSASLVVSEIMNGDCSRCARSAREASETDKEAVWLVSERIAGEGDALLGEDAGSAAARGGEGAPACSCSAPIKGIDLHVDGRVVSVTGLPLIFAHLAENGTAADDSSADKLLETVRIYHPIEPHEESDYRAALVSAYKDYRRNL